MTQPFKIDIPNSAVHDLRHRLNQIRWPDEVEGAGWDYGVSLGFLKDWTTYWGRDYDWRKEEARLNDFPQILASIDGLEIHAVHLKSSHADARPILLLHGWPSSFVQLLDLAKLLSEPEAGKPAFHVVIASLPGFGFSSRAHQKGMNVFAMGAALGKLMIEALGYKRFGIRASDLGAGAAAGIGAMHPEAVTGFHFSGSNPFVFYTPGDLSPAEQEFVKQAEHVRQTEGAYAMMHATKPTTASVGLNDSPAGLAAWILEKFHSWSDLDGQPLESVYRKDDLLTNLSIYWFTETIGSSMRAYYESFHAAVSGGAWGKSPIPVAMAMPRHDLVIAPREWEERTANIVRWTPMPRGGHFIDWEQPALIAADVQAFFAKQG